MFFHHNTGVHIPHKAWMCLLTLQRLLLTNGRNETSQHGYDSFLYLAILPTLALTISGRRLCAHKRAGGSSPVYKRLLFAFVISNAAAALCQLITAMTIYVHLVSYGVISDWLNQSMLLVRISTIFEAFLTWTGLYFNSTSVPSRFLFGPVEVLPSS